ncbi:hypothetical protein TIFTF001_000523 [Ficus carica]|uniref:Uncharacterized protein n=1 Tax=Ficus carica TaxID=3494 RepID=A0AA88D1J1_FICCA|nr:hypothetical protein TIFTF001_000523 [Ficus carica]
MVMKAALHARHFRALKTLSHRPVVKLVGIWVEPVHEQGVNERRNSKWGSTRRELPNRTPDEMMGGISEAVLERNLVGG